MVWRIFFLYFFLLIILRVDGSGKSVTVAINTAPTVAAWLLKPESRAAEREPNARRIPEAMCPTRREINDAKSILESGSVFEVQWHQRGHGDDEAAKRRRGAAVAKLELLAAESNSIIARLDEVAPLATVASVGDDEVMTKLVRIPENFDCRDCILRLTVDVNAQSQVVSCADVQIIPSNNRSAEIAECSSNSDCGKGECYRNFCYCPTGSFGPQCANGSHYTSELAAEVESSKYHAFTFPNQGQFLWRVDREANAIEMALRVPRSSAADWYILGLRPEDEAAKAKCMRMMSAVSRNRGVPIKSEESINSVRVDSPSIGIVPVAPVRNDSAKNNLNIKKIAGQVGDSCGENEHWSTCPEYSRECEPSCDWTSFPESIPSCPKTCGEARCVCQEGYVRAANDNSACRPFDYCQAAEVVPECPRNETWAKCGTACEPSCETMYDVEPCTSTCQTPACTCADNYVRHNGECIFWANCPHLEERFLNLTGSGIPAMIGNEESGKKMPSPKTPQYAAPTTAIMPSSEIVDHVDSNDGAFVTDDETDAPSVNGATVGIDAKLKCAANETVNECGRVCEVDCVTIFERDDCMECGLRPACSCKQGFARHASGHCVYWNDCPIEKQDQVHSTPSNIPLSTPKGTSETTQKKTSISSTIAPSSLESEPVLLHDCFGEWVWPLGCSRNCDYKISWIYTPETDLIDFALETRIPPNWWSGVGFADSKSESNVDWIVVSSRNGGVLSLFDAHSNKNGSLNQSPSSDVAFPTDAKLGTHANGVLRAAFSRRRSVTNATMADFSDGHCQRIFFPVSGGRVQSENGSISALISQPYFTTQQICIRACEKQTAKESNRVTTSETIVSSAFSSVTSTPSATLYSCQSEFHSPAGCDPVESCEYRARWMLDPQRGDVAFEVNAKGIGRWTGIGLSEDGQMSHADMYIGWVYDQHAYVTDRFSADRQMPLIDKSNDIYNISGSLKDDVQTIAFRRKVITADNATDYALDRCLYFLFPVGGGRVMARQSDDFRDATTPIGYHDQAAPEVSAHKICLCLDDVPIAPDVSASQIIPSTVAITVSTSAAQSSSSNVSATSSRRRVRRQIAVSLTAADDAFVCSDIALVELRDSGTKVRVADAFALSRRSIVDDAFSFSDVSAHVDGEMLTILVRKSLNESEANDVTITDGPATVYVGSGHGSIDFNSSDISIELTRMNLIHPEMRVGKIAESTSSEKSDRPTTEPMKNDPSDEIATSDSNGPFDVTGTQSTVTRDDMITPEKEKTTANTDANTSPKNSETNTVAETETETTRTTVSIASSPTSPVEMTSLQKVEKEETSTDSMDQSTTVSQQVAVDENCAGTFKYPDGCTVDSCQYNIQWHVNGAKKSVDFELSAVTANERWTGIGFSPDGAMANADVIIVSVLKDSMVTVMDQFSFGYGRPRVDKMQDVFNAESAYRDGRVRANFSRNLDTGDTEDDVDLLSGCQRFIFLHLGGELEGGSEQIRKHTQTPIVSREKICLGKCGLIESMTTTTTIAAQTVSSTINEIVTKSSTSVPRVELPDKKKPHSGEPDLVHVANVGGSDVTPTVPPAIGTTINRLYDVVVRLMREKWSAELEDAESERFIKLTARIKNALMPAFSSRWPSFKAINIMKFAEGSVLALLQIEFDGESTPGEVELREFLHELMASDNLSNSAAAALGIDSDAIQVRENTRLDLEDKWGPLREFGTWLIVGILLVVLVVICALCLACICRRRSSRIKNNKSMHSFSPHYAYQYTSSAYPTGITNAAFVGGIPNSKDMDATKTTNGSGSASTASSSASTRAAKKNGIADGPRIPKSVSGGISRYVENSEGASSAATARRADCPRGIGETTYQEWFAKVASKDAPSHYQESSYVTPPIRRQLGGRVGSGLPYSPIMHQPCHQQSYVTYPNDPGSYYTLNGEHKLPPPSYYHRH